MNETLGHIGFSAPEDWYEIDVDPATSEASIRRLVHETLAGPEWRPELAAQYEAQLRFVVGRCQEIGAIAAMGFADLISEPPYLLNAGVILAMIGTGDEDVDAATIQRQLGERGHELEPVSLPVGPALRSVTRSEELAPGTDTPVEVLSAKYYVPAGRSIALLAFTTPTIALADEFLELFEAIAETLEID